MITRARSRHKQAQSRLEAQFSISKHNWGLKLRSYQVRKQKLYRFALFPPSRLAAFLNTGSFLTASTYYKQMQSNGEYWKGKGIKVGKRQFWKAEREIASRGKVIVKGSPSFVTRGTPSSFDLPKNDVADFKTSRSILWAGFAGFSASTPHAVL